MLPYSCFKVFILLSWFLSPWPTSLHPNTMACSKTSQETFPSSFCLFLYMFFFFLRFNGGCPSAVGCACWAVPELSEISWSQHKPSCRNLRHPLWQTGKTLEQNSCAEPLLNRSVAGSTKVYINEMLINAFVVYWKHCNLVSLNSIIQ